MTKKNRNKKNGGIVHGVYSFFSTLFICMMCIFALFTFFFRAVSVSGDSMYPTLRSGDKIIISDFLYTPSYGDIIVIGRENGDEPSVIKRVIALSGDEVFIDFDTHIIKVNGKVLTEKYEVAEPISRKGDVLFPLTVPENHVFVLGDNRNNSLDSRFEEIGFVGLDEITGKALTRIFPIGKSKIY